MILNYFNRQNWYSHIFKNIKLNSHYLKKKKKKKREQNNFIIHKAF